MGLANCSPPLSLSSSRVSSDCVAAHPTTSSLPWKRWHSALPGSIFIHVHAKSHCAFPLNKVEPSSSNKLSFVAASSLSAVSERTIALPIDYYQVLGVDTGLLADAVTRAYESRTKNPPEEGFSKDALLARQEILAGAYETLIDPELLLEYNDGLAQNGVATIMVDVPFSKVPGVLCLLQEVGEMDIVLQVGKTLLQERLTKTYRRDVILSMALAFIELSRESMAKSPPSVMQSFEFLERSLKLLHEEGDRTFAPALLEQIEKTLQQLNPSRMLELLALPLDKEHEEYRKKGIQGIKSILWAVGEGGILAAIPGFTREEFMRETFSRMTAHEVMDLFMMTPSNIPAESFEVYAVALAHIAQGFLLKKPHLIREADTLILELQHANAALTSSQGDFYIPDQKLEFAFERGMCALLLGEIDDCCAWLGLGDPNSPYRDESIMEFVMQNSSVTEEGDFLEGLCRLLECWIGEVIFTTFRELNNMQVKLKDYFDDSGVLNYLESSKKGISPLAAAAAIVQIGAGASAALDNVKTSALETLRKVFFSGSKTSMGFTMGNGGVYNAHESHTKTLYEHDAIHIENIEIASNNSHKPDMYPQDARSDKGDPENGERDNSRWIYFCRIAGTSLLIGSVSFVCWKTFSPRFGGLQFQKRKSASTHLSGSSGVLTRILQRGRGMDVRVAENLVRDWQATKAKALGHEHDIEKLSEVLDGQMLNSWRDRAREISQNGWYWEYQLTDLKIDSVIVKADGRAVVEATLWEGATLYDEKNKDCATDSYHSSYTTRYELVLSDEGRWKITSGAVIRC